MLILVRHGRTAANAAGLVLGRLDIPLDDVGRAQAQALARALPEVVHIISSPLLRARETADAFGRPVVIDDRWIELDYGELDGRPVASLHADGVWDRWRDDLSYAPTGGESLVELGERVGQACEELMREAAERDVVVVSHVSPIKAAVAWAVGVSMNVSWRTHLDQASITTVLTDDRNPVLRSFNETSHLAAMIARP